MNILVVDDDNNIRILCSKILEQYCVTTAINGLHATKLLETGSYDLVITDIFMPEKDGYELITDILQKYPEQKIICMSSGHVSISRSDGLRMAYHFGANVVLEKPFTKKRLLEIVKKVLEMR